MLYVHSTEVLRYLQRGQRQVTLCILQRFWGTYSEVRDRSRCAFYRGSKVLIARSETGYAVCAFILQRFWGTYSEVRDRSRCAFYRGSEVLTARSETGHAVHSTEVLRYLQRGQRQVTLCILQRFWGTYSEVRDRSRCAFYRGSEVLTARSETGHAVHSTEVLRYLQRGQTGHAVHSTEVLRYLQRGQRQVTLCILQRFWGTCSVVRDRSRCVFYRGSEVLTARSETGHVVCSTEVLRYLQRGQRQDRPHRREVVASICPLAPACFPRPRGLGSTSTPLCAQSQSPQPTTLEGTRFESWKNTVRRFTWGTHFNCISFFPH